MITGTLSLETFLAAQAIHRRKYKKRQIIFNSVFVVFGGSLLFTDIYNFSGMILVGAGVGGILAEYTFMGPLNRRQSTKVFNQQAALREKFIYEWDDEALSVSTSSGHARRLWKNYVKFMESTEAFMLYHSDQMFEIIPKSWFASEDKIEDFRRIANRIAV